MGFDGNILFFDIASVTGFAAGRPSDTPRCGHHDARQKNGDNGDLGLSFGNFCQGLIRAERPEVIVFEEPLSPQWLKGATNPKTTAILYGMPFLLETITKKYGIKILQLNVARIRKHFVPEMKIPKDLKGDKKKREISRHVLEQCRNLGWAPTTGDEADALAGWSTARSYLVPKYALETVSLPLQMPEGA